MAEAAVVIVQDSAGVELVYSAEPLSLGSDDGWSVSPVPILEVCPDPFDSAAVLHRVVGATVFPDGRVAIANLGDNTIRFHEATGELLGKVGGSGQGPGEFRQLRWLVRRQDELWAVQILPLPVNVFDLQGNYLRSVSMPPVMGPQFRGFLADGSAVATVPYRVSYARSSTDSAAVVRFGPSGTDTIVVLPSLRRIAIPGFGAEVQALGPHLHVTTGDDLVYASFSSDWDVGVWREGVLVRRIRRGGAPIPVTREHRAAYRDALLREAGDDPGARGAYEMLADNMIYPDHHPMHSRLLVDSSGFLWVERPQTEPPWSEAIDYAPVPPHPSLWDVFSPEGAWLSTVEYPARFRVLEIGDSYVIGVARDDLDVEAVQVWGLKRVR